MGTGVQNGDASALYLHKPENYKNTIREYVRLYASPGFLLKQDEDTMSTSSGRSLSDFSEEENADMELR